MDRLVGLLVRFMVALSRAMPLLSRLGLNTFDSWEPGKKIKVLLVGYNGVRNTGADVRVATIVEQLKTKFGKDAIEISVMTLDIDAVSVYFDESIKLIKFDTLFFIDALKACSTHHLAILCEGSTLKSKFANALTLFYCEVAGIMKAQGKPCLAYGSEAGEMDSFLQNTVRDLCSDTYFIARTQNSLDVIKELGLQGHLGTDTAWTFDSSAKDGWINDALTEKGWNGVDPLFGVAVINPFWWPVRPSLARYAKAVVSQNWQLRFRTWYFFSWSKQREQQLEVYLDALAATINTQVQSQGYFAVVVGMEKLDEQACEKLIARLDVPSALFLSREHDGYELVALLRKLSCLITSRYHASVLSMSKPVPTVAVSMDERLDNLFGEMNLEEALLCKAGSPALEAELASSLNYLHTHNELVKNRVREQEIHCLSLMEEMIDFLGAYIEKAFSQDSEKESESISKTGNALSNKPCSDRVINASAEQLNELPTKVADQASQG